MFRLFKSSYFNYSRRYISVRNFSRKWLDNDNVIFQKIYIRNLPYWQLFSIPRKKYTFIHKPSNSLKESLSSFEMDFVSDNKYWVYNVYACYCHTQNTELIICSMQTLCWFKSFRRWISMNVTLLGPQPTITKFIYKCYGIDILCSYVLCFRSFH